MLVLLLLIPLSASIAIGFCRSRRIMEWVHGGAAGFSLLAGAVIAFGFAGAGPVTPLGSLDADALSAFMIAIIALVAAVAGIYAVGYVRVQLDGSQVQRAQQFYILFQLFVFTTLLAVSVDNLGVMCIAIEGAVLASVFLLNLNDSQAAIRAAFKYLLVTSVGIVLAFLGTALLYYAVAVRAGDVGLSWTTLMSVAGQLDPGLVRAAFGFILIGYGTLAGLAPMHPWLPDVYSEAPPPVSALLSGILSNVGIYALIRFKAVADAVDGGVFSSTWLLRFGLLSLAVAALYLVSQRSHRRILAFSCIEHTGIIALGLGFGGYWGIAGALFHMMNHAVTKSMLFIVSGSLVLKYRTDRIDEVRGLLRAAPLTACAFLCGMLALMGLPPFGLFVSGFAVFSAGFASHPAYAAAGIAFAAVAFAGMFTGINRMLHGPLPEGHDRSDPLKLASLPIVVNAVLIFAFGLFLPGGLRALFDEVLRGLGVPL